MPEYDTLVQGRRPDMRQVMEDLLRDADTRVLSEAPEGGCTRPIFLRDTRQDVWAAELSTTSSDLILRFPCHHNSRRRFAPEHVFGLEASFHAASCIVAWVTVPPEYRRRKLALWMVHLVSRECSRIGMKWISGTIEPNDEALHFWLSFNPELTKDGKPVRPDQAKNRRGIKFTLDVNRLAEAPSPLALLTEGEFESAIHAADAPVSNPPLPLPNTDPLWLPM